MVNKSKENEETVRERMKTLQKDKIVNELDKTLKWSATSPLRLGIKSNQDVTIESIESLLKTDYYTE